MCWGFRACERDAWSARGGSQGLTVSSIACGVSDGVVWVVVLGKSLVCFEKGNSHGRLVRSFLRHERS
mgnify:FL=1